MARKRSLIAGGSESASAILKRAQQNPAGNSVVDMSEKALSKRAEERKTLPQHPLQFTYISHSNRKKKVIELDFRQLAESYPHHLNLINQLLVGISLSIPPGLSRTVSRNFFGSVESIINFLNDKRSLNQIKVNSVADIDSFVLQAYKTHLTSNFPKRTTNNTLYCSLATTVKTLRQRFCDDILIGAHVPLPRAPQRKNKHIEGYNSYQIRELIKCCIVDIKSIKKFHADYKSLNDNSVQLKVCKRGQNTPWKHNADQHFALVLATIKNNWPNYPFYMAMDKIQALFDRDKINDEENALRVRINTALATGSSKISFMNGKLGRGAIFAAQHFVPDTIYPFLLLSLIATGFNAECLKFLPDNIKEFIDDDILDPDNYVIIYGYKARTDKVVPVRSKKKQANGAYKLLEYVASVVTQFKDSEHYVKGALFQFTRQKLATKNDDEGLICTFHGSANRFSRMGQSFVKRHGLTELIGCTIEDKKIRSGFATVALQGGATLPQIAEQLGHSDAQGIPDTADKHYLSDTHSVAVKNKVITNIQNNLVSDIRNYKHRIVTSKTLQQLRDSINAAKNESERHKKIQETARALNLDNNVVVHLLDAGAQTYILACEDMTNPTWPGNKNFVKNGKCRQFNKCCLCRQAVVFPEALPFIAKRIIDLEKSQCTMTAIEWVTNFGDERDSWRSILDAWNNRDQVQNAWEMAKSGKVLLPKVMRGGDI